MPHPSVLTEWAEDVKQWPDVIDISTVNYLVLSEAQKHTATCTVTEKL